MAARDLRAGREYGDEIIRGIEMSRSLVLVLSEAANESVFVRREVERAVSKRKPIFPIRLEEIVPSPSLELFVSATHWIDAWSGRLVDHVDHLARELASESITTRPALRPPPIKRSRGWKVWIIAGAAVAFLVGVTLIGREFGRRAGRAQPSEALSSPAVAVTPSASASASPVVVATPPPSPTAMATPIVIPSPLPTSSPDELSPSPPTISVGDEDFTRLTKEGDEAVAAATKASLDAQQRFQKLLDEVQKSGLIRVRAQRKDSGKAISLTFAKSAMQFRLAASKSTEAAQHHSDARVKKFLKIKAEGYRLGADAREMTQQMVTILMNEPGSTILEILPKLQELATRRDKVDKAAVEKDREADAMAKAASK
jgi:TIR domain